MTRGRRGTPHDCVLFDEIQTMFPQLANQPPGVLPADTFMTCMFTDHVLKKQGSMVLRKKQKREIEGGTVSLLD